MVYNRGVGSVRNEVVHELIVGIGCDEVQRRLGEAVLG